MPTLSPGTGKRLGGHGRPGWRWGCLGMFGVVGFIHGLKVPVSQDVYSEIGDGCHHPPIRLYWTLIMSDYVD